MLSHDVVQTQDEAVDLAMTLLQKADDYRKEYFRQKYKDASEEAWDPKFIYTLREAETHAAGWILVFLVDSAIGATMDPPFKTIYINRKTGGAKFDSFD